MGKIKKHWDEVSCATLLDMMDAGQTRADCAAFFGITVKAVSAKYIKLRPHGEDARRWTAEEKAELIRLRNAGDTFPQIADKMGRSAWACRIRYFYCMSGERTGVRSPPKRDRTKPGKTFARLVLGMVAPIPAAAPEFVRNTSTSKYLMEAELRERLAGIFGGPPPGRSALDKRNAGASA